MREIRAGLEERLKTTRERIEALQRAERNLVELLEAEDADLFGISEGPHDTESDADALREFLMQRLSFGEHLSVQQIKEAADALDFEIPGDNPGRRLNMTLLNMRRTGLVEKDDEGNWYQPNIQPEAEASDETIIEDDIPF